MLHGSELVTPRLRVRPFEECDVEPLVDLFRDARVHRYVDDGKPLERSLARLWIERSRANLARYGYGTGAVAERSKDELIGWAGFARPGDGSEEIIYGLSPTHWGRGLGRELAGALVDFAKARGQLPVRATVDIRNRHSIAVLEALGFERAAGGLNGDPGTHLYLLS